MTCLAPAGEVRKAAHVAHIEGLRGVAAFWVLALHFRQLGDVLPMHEVWERIPLMSYGWLGVPIFIVISGHCLGLPIAEGKPFDQRTFARRRARRILPAYVAALLISLVCALSTTTLLGRTMSLGHAGTRLALDLAFVQDFFPVALLADLDPPTWSVALETQIYFVFAVLLVPLWRTYGVKTALLAALVVGALGTVVLTGNAHAWLLILFGAGLFSTTVRNMAPPWLAGALLAATGVAVLSGDASIRSELLIGAATAAFLSSKPGVLSRLLALRPIVGLGRISYSLYLLHFPLLVLVATVVIRYDLGGVGALLYVACVPAIVALSSALYAVAERPFLSSPSARRRRAGAVTTKVDVASPAVA